MDLFGENTVKSGAAAMPPALRAAIDSMVNIDPFIAAYIGGVQFVPRDDIQVMATDCVSKIFYNPALDPNKWTPDNLACVIAHEVQHILRLDAELMTGLDHGLANQACDAIINRDLQADGWRFPGLTFADPITDVDAQADGIMSNDPWAHTMQIYRKLAARQKKDGKTPKPGDFGGVDMQAYGEAIAEAGGADAAQQQIAENAATAARIAPMLANGNRPQNTPAKDQPRPNRHQQAPSASDAELGLSSNDTGGGWSLEDSSTARLAERHGVVIRKPNTLVLRSVGARVKGLMTARTSRASSYLVPSHRSDDFGRLMPGRRRKQVIRPAVAIDASGSITDEMLRTFTEASQQWTQRLCGRTTQIECCYWDTRIAGSGRISQYRHGAKLPQAGGGTAFSSVITWLEKLPQRPTHVLVFTDLCFYDYPETPPHGIEFLWIVPPKYAANARVPFGKVVAL